MKSRLGRPPQRSFDAGQDFQAPDQILIRYALRQLNEDVTFPCYLDQLRRIGRNPNDQDVAEKLHESPGEALEIPSARDELIDHFQNLGRVPFNDGPRRSAQYVTGNEPEQIGNVAFFDTRARRRDDLIHSRQTVAHATLGGPGNLR